jgi:AraC-like DNA-binding protein
MSTETSALYKRIDALLFANPCIMLPELAVSLGIDRRRIEGALQERYGCGFRTHKNRVRLSRIISLLAEDDPRISIKEIAAAVDIIPNNLHRFVRSMTGCCIRELRGDERSFQKLLWSINCRRDQKSH